MNRFVADGLVNEAYEAGLRVLVVLAHHGAVAPTLRMFEEFSASAEVRRARGAEEIRFPSGGQIWFVSANSRGHRGVAADIVFIDVETDRDRLAMELAPHVQNSPVGEIVFA